MNIAIVRSAIASELLQKAQLMLHSQRRLTITRFRDFSRVVQVK